MSIDALQFGSLSPTITPSRVADQTTTEFGALQLPSPATLSEVKPFLPVYDDNSDVLIQGIIDGVTKKIERFIRLDTTERTRISEWFLPQRLIDIPYGFHSDIVVEQYVGDEWRTVENPIIIGLTKKSVRLHYGYQTRVTCTSGFADCPADIVQAIIQEVSFQYKNRNDPNEVQPETRNGLSIPTINLISHYSL